MSKAKASKLKRLNKSSVSRVAKAIIPSENSCENLATTILQQTAELPWFELYPERKQFLSIVETEYNDEFTTLVSSLCDKYSEMLKSFRGKLAFLDLQIQWHQFIRSVAASVETQATEDAQLDTEYEEAASNSPVANAWLSIVTAASSHEIPNKATQFAVLHQFGSCIYLHQHAKALETTNAASVEDTTTHDTTDNIGDENSIVALIRMCGSQLQGTYKKLNEAKRARQKSSLEEQLALIDNICMNQEEKALAHAYLPITDGGGMRFPRREFFPFLKEFDSIVRSELNYTTFTKHGQKLFQVITPKMEKHKEKLFESFRKCVPNSFTRTAITEVYGTLFDKMVNLRKDMEKSWERVHGIKSGKSVTLNLRDELKPYAAKKME